MVRPGVWGVGLFLLSAAAWAKPNADPSQLLARAALYSELAQELGRTTADKATVSSIRDLGEQVSSDHHEANRRLADFVLSQHLNLPQPALDARQRLRAQWVMQKLALLKTLQGTTFDGAALELVEALPSLWKEDIHTEGTVQKRVINPLWSTLETHRKAAQSINKHR